MKTDIFSDAARSVPTLPSGSSLKMTMRLHYDKEKRKGKNSFPFSPFRFPFYIVFTLL